MNEKVVKILKEYRLTIFAIVAFGTIISIGVKGAAKQQRLSESKIEIPLPLQNTSEQVMLCTTRSFSLIVALKMPISIAEIGTK